MAAINQEAIQDLNIALDLLMPDALESGVDAVSTLSFQSIVPTGLGGFIQPNQGGSAYIHGRRIHARYCVILQGNNVTNLHTSANTVIESLLGVEKETLLNNGILRIAQSGSDYQTLSGSNREFKLSFELIYEYRQAPETLEEIIDEIPVNLLLDTGE